MCTGLFVCSFQNYKTLKMADFAETEMCFPIKHEILQNSWFRLILVKTRFPVEKMKTRLVLGNTVATQANLLRFQSFANGKENLSEVCQTFYRFLSRRFQQPLQTYQNVFGIGDSVKQKFRVFKVYRFRNWYQSITPIFVSFQTDQRFKAVNFCQQLDNHLFR